MIQKVTVMRSYSAQICYQAVTEVPIEGKLIFAMMPAACIANFVHICEMQWYTCYVTIDTDIKNTKYSLSCSCTEAEIILVLA